MKFLKGNKMNNLRLVGILACALLIPFSAQANIQKIIEGASYWFEKRSFSQWESIATKIMNGGEVEPGTLSESEKKVLMTLFDNRKGIDGDMLTEWSQDELDLLYALLPSGPIPHGSFDGDIILAKGGPLTILREKLGDKKADKMKEWLVWIGEKIWKGKVFSRRTMVLQNRINIGPGLTELTRRLMFPAKLFCGQSRFDSRRESVIIDYAYNETLEGVPGMYGKGPAYGGDVVPELRKGLDRIVGRNHLNIRDEIRMIRPGVYLGRAYISNAFVLNFVLEKSEDEDDPMDYDTALNECWSNYQPGLAEL